MLSATLLYSPRLYNSIFRGYVCLIAETKYACLQTLKYTGCGDNKVQIIFEKLGMQPLFSILSNYLSVQFADNKLSHHDVVS